MNREAEYGDGAHDNGMGPYAEQLASDHLVTEGYAIRERNWRMGHLEVDIIAQKGTTIVFVEVKSRKGDYQDPLESIDAKKIQRTCRAADVYMRQLDADFEARFDVIAVTGTRERHTLEHIPEAFFPPLRTYR